MRSAPVPWIGLAAMVAMFVIPLLPDWLFEGPRTVRHRPRRHVCGDCGAPWTGGHSCAPEAGPVATPPLRGELRRPRPVVTTSRGRPALADRRRSRAR